MDEYTVWLQRLVTNLVTACENAEPVQDPVAKEFPGSPEAAAASFARGVMEADEESAEELSTMFFVG